MRSWLAALDLQLDLIRFFRTDPYGAVIGQRALHLGGDGDDPGEEFSQALDREDYDRCDELAAAWKPQANAMELILRDAATYWVSPEMSRFLNYAYQDMPSHQIRPEDLPSPAGFVFFAEPLEFQLGPGSSGLLIWAYDPEVPEAGLRTTLLQRHESRYPTPITWLATTYGLLDGQPSVTCDRLAHAFWVLSEQRIAATERLPVERHARKRAERVGFKVPEDGIRVVTLRRPQSKMAPGLDNQRVVEWSHRWIVSGHWRDQWYPSDEEHRPKWIDAYPKGPEGKPLVLKDRVYKWVR